MYFVNDINVHCYGYFPYYISAAYLPIVYAVIILFFFLTTLIYCTI